MEQTNKNNLVAKWLFICCFFVALMVLIGGLTRLTGSGLSMTSWHPIHGIFPPIGEGQWLEEFSSYKQSPEYKKINYGMELSEFKNIFWWEYIHRIAGRLTGIIFFIPLIFFTFRGYINKHQFAKLFSVFVIGGVQGVIGWWMVKSGLYDRPSVSHFRLAIHLSFAFLIFSVLLWQGLNFYFAKNESSNVSCDFKKKVNLLIFIFVVQVIYGAFIAGLDGGLTYNTWPLMDGRFVPNGFMENGVSSLLNDIISIQFIHRWLAIIFLILVFRYFLSFKASVKKGKAIAESNRRLLKANKMLISAVLIQIIIGINTLVLVVPVALASIHQMMALVILGNLVFIRRVMNG